MIESKVRKYIVVDGIVQGVGFRWHVQRVADACHLTGWVSNRYDGKVEMEVQGFQEDVDRFCRHILRGNGFAQVMSYEEEKCDVISELDFRIR